MIAKRTVYVTSDGTIFKKESNAKAYDKIANELNEAYDDYVKASMKFRIYTNNNDLPSVVDNDGLEIHKDEMLSQLYGMKRETYNKFKKLTKELEEIKEIFKNGKTDNE